MGDRTRIIEKIVKLFNIAEHTPELKQTGATEAEMMLALTRARQMMIDHNITLAELNQVKDGESAARMAHAIKLHTAYTRRIRDLAVYDQIVAKGIEHLFGVKALYFSGRHNFGFSSIRFVGDEEDTAIAVEVFHIILSAVRRAARVQYGGGNAWKKRHTSYALGYAQRIADRAEALSIQKAEGVVALVLHSKANAINAFMANVQYAPKDKKERKQKVDWTAYVKGQVDGDYYNLEFRHTVRGKK